MAETDVGREPKQEERSEGSAGGLIGRLAGAGEDAVKRVYDELERSERAHEALQRLAGARDRLEKLSRSAMQQLGVASMEEVESLRKQVNLLDKRVRTLERDATGESGAAGAADTGTRAS
jgi:hypothetical protein